MGDISGNYIIMGKKTGIKDGNNSFNSPSIVKSRGNWFYLQSAQLDLGVNEYQCELNVNSSQTTIQRLVSKTYSIVLSRRNTCSYDAVW